MPLAITATAFYPPSISASPFHIQKTLINLVSNAIEAMPQGGQITIKTFNRYLDKPISGYDNIREGDYVVASVSSEQQGIPLKYKCVYYQPLIAENNRIIPVAHCDRNNRNCSGIWEIAGEVTTSFANASACNQIFPKCQGKCAICDFTGPYCNDFMWSGWPQPGSCRDVNGNDPALIPPQ